MIVSIDVMLMRLIGCVSGTRQVALSTQHVIAFMASMLKTHAARCRYAGVNDPARQHVPHGSLPHTAGEKADDVDRPPLFARAMQASPVKAEPGDLQHMASNDGSKPVMSGAAASSRPGSKHSGDAAALISGADAGAPAKAEPPARAQAGDAAAASDTEARPSEAKVDGGSMPEQQQVEPAPRKGHAKAGVKRKHGNEPRNGESACRPAKAARVPAPPPKGKVGMRADSQHSV